MQGGRRNFQSTAPLVPSFTGMRKISQVLAGSGTGGTGKLGTILWGVRMSLSPPRKSSAQRLAVAPSPPFVFGLLVLGLACCATAHASLAAASRKAALRCDAWASHRGGFSCEAAALGRTGFRSSCTRAWLLRGLWHLPRPGVKSMSPLLAGRPLSAVPPGKPSFTSGGWNTPHTVQSVYNCLIMCFS